jgi:PQQ-like domain
MYLKTWRCQQVYLFAILTLSALPSPLHAQVDVLENRYDGARTGANLSERMLTPANVNVNQFGKLYSYPVDGSVYAQPLYVRGVVIRGTARNVVYIATMNDKVYAFDADSASPSPLWMTDFTNGSSVTAIPVREIVANSRNIYGNVGIESTPVINKAANKMYLVARTKEGGGYVQRLHAIDIRTGAEFPGSPVTITASVPGVAPDSTIGANGQRVITFEPRMHQQRAALALTNGVVLIAWAAHEDVPPYHGWIMGYNATTLAQVGAFAVSPDQYGGGIWQGGRAPTIDSEGNAYFATGNGKWDGTRHFGDSLLKFRVSTGGISLLDYFTPGNEATLSANDDDLSGSGFTLLPGNLLLGGGKEGVLYLLNAGNLGKKVSGDSQIPQRINVQGGHVMGGPVFWNTATAGSLVYNWNEDDVLIAYRLAAGKLTAPHRLGLVQSPGHPGGSLTISANGSDLSTGIVWSSIPTRESAKHILTAGTLRAFDAEDLTEIWNSDQNFARDGAGTLIKFVPPLVANGKVFMASHDGSVAVYGLLPKAFSLSVTPRARNIAAGASATFSVAVAADSGFAETVNLTAGGAPSGTTVTFSPQSITGPGVVTMTVALAPGTSPSPFALKVTGTGRTQVRSAWATINGAEEIVLYARNAKPIVGTWRIVTDPTAAGGARIEQPDAGVPKIPAPAAAPANYFELAFTARANTPYRLWVRARAQNNSYSNDSIYVQFSGSLTSTGTPAFRIGTTQATTYSLENCTGCGVAGWGWQDNGYGAGVLGPALYFTGGPQTIRIQGREDGISIDQIVLSPLLYLNQSPGGTKSDSTILPPSSRTIVRWAAEKTFMKGNWQLVNDASAAGGVRIEQSNAGVPKIPVAAANPENYFELTFNAEPNTAYRLWIRGRALSNSYSNDSVYVQFSGSVTSSGAPINRISTTEAAWVSIEDCTGCGLSGWGWQDNGYGAGALGPLLYFSGGQQKMRIQGREDGISIDQIVLSPDDYVMTRPGATKNDTTILSRTF